MWVAEFCDLYGASSQKGLGGLVDTERIRKLKERFAAVEQRLKNIEYNADGGLNVPCVNQLRYVGYHLLKYITSGDSEAEKIAAEAEISEAESHCSRALYDSYEVEALYYLSTFQDFQSEYRDLPISDSVPDFLTWCDIEEGVAEFIRTHKQSDGRGAYYDQLSPHVVSLQQIHAKLPRAREELNKKRNFYAKGDKKANAGLWVGIAAILIAIFCWLQPEMGKELAGAIFGKTQLVEKTEAATSSDQAASATAAPPRP